MNNKTEKFKFSVSDISTKNISGFSLMEMLVVIFVFSILGIVTTQILALSLRGSQKSESVGESRANIEYAVSTMERLLRNAKSLECVNPLRLEYLDEYHKPGFFECDSSDSKIASGSAFLTSDQVEVLCDGSYAVFTCSSTPGVPQEVKIEVRGRDAELGTGAEGSSVTIKTQVMLRTYE